MPVAHHQHNDRTFRVSEVQKLEDPERLRWMPPEQLIGALRLGSGMTVADVGAGTGYFAIPIACVVERVYAVDFQREMLALFRAKLKPHTNIELVEGEARATTLPFSSCDAALLANVWHELEQRQQVLAEMRRILKPSGVVAIFDWRHDVERPPGPSIEHRIPAGAVADELRSAGWRVARTQNIGRFSYLLSAS